MQTHTSTRFSSMLLYVLACLAFAAAAIGMQGCMTTPDGARASSAVFSFTAVGEDGKAIGIGRSDLNTSMLYAQATGTAEVFQKPSATMPNGFPLFGPITGTAGKVYVHRRDPEFSQWFSAGEPLPAFVLVLYRPGEIEALGFSVDTVTP